MKATLDKLGMALSGLCAIQCALLPIMLSLSAVVPSWAHIGHGWLWMSVIGLIALWSFFQGWKIHHCRWVLFYAIIGYTVLLLATILEERVPVLMESVLFVIGGLLMVVAHWRNYKKTNCARVIS